ncbi:helix-turn-helix domain-containing protein [Haloferax sp. KTX1]|uniref:helix-turn-helix domain-containing protein n=1 Tax=Haloferax sp. KTX1 TaxID=2600597 RepID=UPI0011DDD746|nr:helix-turn-helix domain-containing protein [Haloferax sp. KTX1]
MPAGIRATVEFASPSVCPVASVAHSTDSVVDSVSTSVVSTPGDVSVSEFVVEADDPPEASALEPIFSYGSKHLYRYTHDGSAGCPCECLGEFGCPVDRYFAQRGSLTLVFHAADYEQLQAVIGELRERFPGLDIKRLVRSPTGDAPGDSVFVDRGKLTTRQLEVLQTAYGMGYFERPRGANATEVAAELGINQSTFSEHLAAALTKLLGDILEEG